MPLYFTAQPDLIVLILRLTGYNMTNQPPTATLKGSDRIVMLSEQVLLTFTGILAESGDPKVRAAAQQLYAEVRKSRIKS